MFISVIISTYNRPDALALVLQSLTEQNYKGQFEVLIADDGSNIETQHVVENFQKKSPFAIQHIWQKDSGFRAAKIRNKAAGKTQGNYLIFIDGDCVPRSSFLKQHANLAENGFFVTGNRVLLTKNITFKVLNQNLPIYKWNLFKWFTMRITGLCNKFFALYNLSFSFWRKLIKRQWRGAKSCNLAIWKKDFINIKGFDEAYQGWGYEDSDLVIRLMGQGIWRKDGRFATTVIHLWHKLYDRSQAKVNWQRFLKSQELNIRNLT